MRVLSKWFKSIAFCLVLALLVSLCTPAVSVCAQDVEQGKKCIIEVDENAVLACRETATMRSVEYYVNGTCIQRAVYNKETGEILSYDLTATLNRYGRTVMNYDESENVMTYHINDFKIKKCPENAVRTRAYDNTQFENHYGLRGNSSGYRLVKSSAFRMDGEDYVRHLYGRTGEREYLEDYWYFEAGVTISAVTAAVGFFVPALAGILKGVSSVAGVLIEAVSIEDWVKECYWEYKFSQSAPTNISFECPHKFPYLKYKRLETTTGSMAEWKLFYEKTSAEIKAERDDILRSPVLYQ